MIKNNPIRLITTAVIAVCLALSVHAQITPGLYIIANSNGYNSTTNTNNFYLCPAEQCYYNGSTVNPYFSTEDNGKPHLTTYKSISHNDLVNAIWEVQAVTSGNNTYYRLYHVNTQRYITSNEMKTISGYAGRLFVHMEASNNPGDNTLFAIDDKGSGMFFIRHKDLASTYSFNPNASNQDQKAPTSARGGIGGTIGRGDDANSNWYFEKAPLLPPTISINTSNKIEITTIFPGATIYYTTDGTTPTTSSSTYSSPFDITNGMTVIKAFIALSGYDDSAVASFDIVVRPGASYPYLIQNQNNTNFYLLPDVLNTTLNITQVCTNSLTRASMMWTFTSAGNVDGVQYYYIKDHSTNQYLCYASYTDASNNATMGLLVKNSSDFDSSDIFKFRLVKTSSNNYNIIPIANTGPGSIYKSFDGANAAYPNNSSDYVAVSGSADTDASDCARWLFVPVFNEKMPAVTPPISASTATHINYYEIESAVGSLFMHPGESYVTTTSVFDDDAKWFFTEADHDDWLTYYYIQHAPTGKYVGLRSDNASMSNAAVLTDLPAAGSATLPRYQFALAPSGIPGQHYLVPRAIVYQGNANYYATLARLDDTPLYTRSNNRADSTMQWILGGPITFRCATPAVSFDNSTRQVTLISSTSDAAIYYTTDGSNPLTSATRHLYNGPFILSDAEYIISAVSLRSSDNSDASEVAMVEVGELEVSSTDEITNMNGRYVLAEGFVVNGSVGTQANPFRGAINGQYHTFDLSTPLIDYADGAEISAVIIGTATVSGSGNKGAICNNALGATRIYNCGVMGGSISGGAYTGGLVGLLDGTSRVINCFNFANITGGTEVGGIVGHNNYATTSVNLHTMIMNCIFYGDITGGTSKAPVYNGLLITNVGNDNGLNNYNYFRYESSYSKGGHIDVYNGAMGAEERFLVRFEQYRYLLNSNRQLAAYYALGSYDKKSSMAKWVLDKSVAPYPILKPQGTYPSIVNYDVNALTSQGTLTVSISQGSGAPSGAIITTASKALTITDQDPDNFNFNYHKVQLPYYNEVGTGNYNKNKVVTGWKITGFTGGTPGVFTTGTDSLAYNFADRKCTDKDKYSVSGRVFAQGAYYDVPDGVTGISIEPYWGKCVYLGDPTWDVTYTEFNDNWGNKNVTNLGTRFTNGQLYNINGDNQKVYTTFPNAMAALAASTSTTVFDNAIVLVGNFHRYCGKNSLTKNYSNAPFTLMSADLDFDNEPDYSLLYQHTGRQPVSPIRFDFLNFIGIGMAHKITNSIRMPNVGIYQPLAWFEITNTCLIYFGQFEYDHTTRNQGPIILQGGVYDQFVSAMNTVSRNTQYIHLGGNAWFKMFNNGRHANKNNKTFTPHIPISVTGGDYDEFYLSGMFQPTANCEPDSAKCYISGGRFGDVAGAGMEQIKGDVTWIIDHANINNFYGGGVNAAKPITGNINVTISYSNVNTYCGGPKFGDMAANKTVTTNATNCEFGRFYGAGYGGTSYNRINYEDLVNATNYPFNTWVTTYYDRKYSASNSGIASNYEYEQLTLTGFATNNTVGRFYVNYASLSLATTNNVTSNLTGCHITNNFYGGGNLGKVSGNVTSTLDSCRVDGSVFGGGYSAAIPTIDVYPIEGMTPEPYYNGQAGVYVKGEMPTPTTYTWHQVAQVSPGNEFDEAKHLIYTTANLQTLGQVMGNTTLTITRNTHVAGLIDGQPTGGVFGGGDASDVNGDTNVIIDNADTATNTILNVFGGGNVANVAGSIDVSIESGKVSGDVYGGGALANTNVTAGSTTTVSLLGGKIYGNAYGGGLGRKGTETVADVDALVGGDVNVIVNGSAVGGNVFGCNNQNGTPKGDVLVRVLRTVDIGGSSEKPERLADGENEDEHRYELAGVYGGGNEAAYIPANLASNKCKVQIDGCDEVSIAYAYGGGNAAPVNQCEVEVLGAYEIGYVFGGGNGSNWSKPGADVGILDAAAYAEDKSTGTYGPGNTMTIIHGGTIHHVFGGSNTRGNIIGEAHVVLGDEDSTYCALHVGEVFSCGNMATIDGTARLTVSCVDSQIEALYGGAKQADVFNDVVLNINSGSIKRVFGGNKTSGVIHGTITVNVEEKGCKPIRIVELYGGGDQAPYTSTGTNGNGPFVNIRSCTSIGTVYGGGFGETAVVTGNPIVDINMDAGYTTTDPNDAPANRTALPLGTIGNVFGGGNAAVVNGNPVVRVGTSGKSAQITGNVFGGGNNADVIGNTHVEVGQ